MKTKKLRLNKLFAGIIVVTLCIGGALGGSIPKRLFIMRRIQRKNIPIIC